jgi:hypothetical protein
VIDDEITWRDFAGPWLFVAVLVVGALSVIAMVTWPIWIGPWLGLKAVYRKVRK